MAKMPKTREATMDEIIFYGQALANTFKVIVTAPERSPGGYWIDGEDVVDLRSWTERYDALVAHLNTFS